ncbi:Cohesin domain [Ruminococcus champanellensis 18P13 = JCM 17042]|uniref:Cohesin domain n=3 Tax=Ruminococcus TaxID=1263 RepID=D4LFJ9_RUMC1|nr:Cohesin domain [Ruminococcus champanellensis 18P13 = JCM 17042]
MNHCMKTGLSADEGCRNPEELRLNNMIHHWIRTGLDRLRRTGAALTAAACALGLPGFFARQTPASAANLVLVYAESVEAQPGDTAQVSLYAEDNGGFSGMGLVLEYDGALELVTNEYGKPLCTYGDLIGSDTCMILEAEGSKCGVAIASSQLIQQDGTLVTLSFRVPQTAQPGDTFALNLTANAAYDNRDNAVSIQTYSGKIQIPQATTTTTTETTTTTTTTETTTAPTTTTAPAPVEFSVGHASGLPGETVYLPVYVGPHSGISDMEFRLQLPEIFHSVLSNDEYQIVGIPSLWSIGSAHNTTGGLALALNAGLNPDVTGELFRIQLVIPEDAAPGEYEISVQSVAIRNPEGTAYTCAAAPGSVQILMPETTTAESTTTTTMTTATTTTTTTATETTTAPGTPVEFSVGNVPGLPGETVYLPVYVGENPGLSAAVLTFRYGGMLQPADANSTPQVQYLKAGYWGEVSYDTQLLTVSMHAAWSQYENGEILRIPVAIPADAVPGIYPVTPESASFAAMDGSTRQCSLFAGTVQVVGAVTTSAQVTENTTTTGYTTTATEAITTTETTIETTTTTTTEAITEATTTTAAETTITTTTTAAETTTVPIQTTTATRTTALQPGYLPGDVNMDGRVTVADAVLVLEACARMAAGEPCPLSDVQQKLGDLVPDGYIKVSDAVELLGIIARGIAG